ncbi:hypothetical protein LSAT2_017662 [Lamellibrachia satsuma]|nr:hypothetical protein LSAT2_017662 [Lamellibrachia satsuma]
MVMELISMEISTNDVLRKMMYVDDLAIIAESMQTIQNYKKCSRNGRGVREARTENEPGEDRSDVGWIPEREVEHRVGWRIRKNSNMSGAPLTPDEENFLRLIRILWDDVPCRLRAFFKSKYHQRFNIAWGDNQQSGEFFIANCDTRHIGQHIIDTIRQGDTAFYDCTALFTCLLNSKTRILHPKPRHGTRTPPVQDSERVDELREMRNELAHSTSASLPSATFNTKLALLNTIYAQLHWNPTVMRQWARDPVVTAECTRLKQLLDAERQRYSGLDLTVQALGGTVHALDGTVQALDGNVTLRECQHLRDVHALDGNVQHLREFRHLTGQSGT